MVKAAKKSIYAVVGERDVNDEELITVDLSEFRSMRRCSIDPQPFFARPNEGTVRTRVR